ncbi:MAG: hypothetical protein D3921_05025 [Candidatus Electrothrix sp. AW1]|nr:hypothetical protein [Candidatus Electrothrix sp. AX1]MCI5177926.1 hypothetical protein [Candidatus Electrothrix gigas]MCI5181868.1 hypothetical protein [Candidatus Electrothrix gigas]
MFVKRFYLKICIIQCGDVVCHKIKDKYICFSIIHFMLAITFPERNKKNILLVQKDALKGAGNKL